MTQEGRLVPAGSRTRLATDVSTVPARGPIRTCVGCRARGLRSDLLRVVLDDSGSPVVDPGRRRPGRGAWLHPDPGCLDLAERRTAFPRALRVQGPLDLSAVRAYVRARGSGQAEQQDRKIVDNGSGLEADGHPMSTQR